ncbi:hypothetical protein [Methylobacterium sp.]|uniref:hypothetical protein n=1 Tax=Methylobacterium sp. TaxID=409 RepID=UPI002600F3A2|nr:hypothetical protein [Methylobacterium sp.]MBY0258537.1 hypothetical protein [Methylobacterium sp.]
MSRPVRLLIGAPPLAAVWVVGFLIEAADDLLTALHPHARQAAIRLRDWMEASR